MNAPFKIKLQPRSVIRANVDARFPANVVGATPIHVDQSGMLYTISININELLGMVGGGVSDGNKGDITVSGAGLTWTINNNAVTTAKIAAGNVTYGKLQNASAASILLGRGAGAGGGGFQEITLGAGLSMSGTTLNAGAGTDAVITLTDGPTVPLDASLGNQFKLLAAGNRTILTPSNPPASGRSQKIIIIHEASGAPRTLSLTTGAAAFRFGSDLTALTATPAGLADYIGAIWNQSDNCWDVVSYARGF